MSDIKISVIVPIHKGEKELDRCLDSLVNQDFSDKFEIICVLDSSTNIVYNVVYKYKKLFKHDLIIKEVSFLDVSKTRNAGLDIARGDYIYFVDGDDFLYENALSTLYMKANLFSVDLVIGNFVYYEDENIKAPLTKKFLRAGFYSKEKMLNLVLEDFLMRGFVWNKLFKRSVIEENNIRFLPCSLTIEDRPFLVQFILCSTLIIVSKKVTYHYVQHGDSFVKATNKLSFMQRYINCDFVVRAILENEHIFDKKIFKSKLVYRTKSLINDARRIEKENEISDKKIENQVKKQLSLLYGKSHFYAINTPWEEVIEQLNFDLVYNVYKKSDLISLSKIL